MATNLVKLEDAGRILAGPCKCGWKAIVAKLIGKRASVISNVISGKTNLTPMQCAIIERATGGLVSRKDLYGEGADIIWGGMELKPGWTWEK